MINSLDRIIQAIVLAGLIIMSQPACLANFGIKHSMEECTFHYMANDADCSLYQFTHCSYYVNTTTYWLWIFRDQVSSHLIIESSTSLCASICCKDNSTLPTGIEGYLLCQERKFAKEVTETETIELVVQLAFGLLLISIASSLLYALYQSLERYLLELRAQPREIEMRLL